MCLAIGGKPVEDISEYGKITHYIACDNEDTFARTFSTMAAFGTATHIIKSGGLIDSFNAKRVLLASDYYLSDSTAQEIYGFSISTTLDNAKSNRPGGLLSGKYVYCSSGTLGKSNAAITPVEMKHIVALFGGTWISTQKGLLELEAPSIIAIVANGQKLSKNLSIVDKAGANLVTWTNALNIFTNQCIVSVPLPDPKIKPSKYDPKPPKPAKQSTAKNIYSVMSPTLQRKKGCQVLKYYGFNGNFGASATPKEKAGSGAPAKLASPKATDDPCPDCSGTNAGK